jgi:hypothetical protein
MQEIVREHEHGAFHAEVLTLLHAGASVDLIVGVLAERVGADEARRFVDDALRSIRDQGR